jgi:exosortase/archaeosortase family protein
MEDQDCPANEVHSFVVFRESPPLSPCSLHAGISPSTVLSKCGCSKRGSARGCFRDRVVLVPKPGVLFSGVITVSCSAVFPVLAMAVLTLGVIPGSAVQRLQRFAVSTLILTAVNFVRLCIVLTAGATRGMNAMAPVHEWVGSLVTLAGWVLTLIVMLNLARRHRTQMTKTPAP